MSLWIYSGPPNPVPNASGSYGGKSDADPTDEKNSDLLTWLDFASKGEPSLAWGANQDLSGPDNFRTGHVKRSEIGTANGDDKLGVLYE